MCRSVENMLNNDLNVLPPINCKPTQSACHCSLNQLGTPLIKNELAFHWCFLKCLCLVSFGNTIVKGSLPGTMFFKSRQRDGYVGLSAPGKHLNNYQMSFKRMHVPKGWTQGTLVTIRLSPPFYCQGCFFSKMSPLQQNGLLENNIGTHNQGPQMIS